MSNPQNYPIGTPGTPWGESEKRTWYARQRIQRSYAGEVLSHLEPLRQQFDLEQYGALPLDPERYPLFAVRSRGWTPAKPCALVTGGVHGYETSGVQGALRFLQTEAERYSD